jgi:hypothetical protein
VIEILVPIIGGGIAAWKELIPGDPTTFEEYIAQARGILRG